MLALRVGGWPVSEKRQPAAAKDKLIDHKVDAYRARIASVEKNLRKESAALSTEAVRLDGTDPVQEYRNHLIQAKLDGETFGDEAKFAARTPFQIDRDKILYSSFFMPLALKTQLIIGQHTSLLRNRLSHTLVVANIARSIAQGLNLNTDLTEAIALGHDIGHAPFGHAGERTLNKWLLEWVSELRSTRLPFMPVPQSIGEHFLVQDEEGSQDPKWQEHLFHHGRQSVKKLEVLEGFNLTRQTLFGIWRHSLKHNKTDSQFAYKFPRTRRQLSAKDASYEAQTVRIADDIAWAAHDMDDALYAGLITMKTLREWKVPLGGGERLLVAILDDYKLGRWVRRFISGVVEANPDLNKARLAEGGDGLDLKPPLNAALESLKGLVEQSARKDKETMRAEEAVGLLITMLADAYWKSASDFRADLERVLEHRGQTESGLDTLKRLLGAKKWSGTVSSKTPKARESSLVQRAALICDFLSALTDEEAIMLWEWHYSPRFRLPPALARPKSQ